jgi:hypoxanthine phosphoribosyltransferase
MESSGEVQLKRLMDVDVSGKIVVLVEDIVDTGSTMKHLRDLIISKNPKKLITCVLIDKQERRKFDVTIDFYGFKVEKGFLVGYGLDYADQFRCLKGIYVIQRDSTQE